MAGKREAKKLALREKLLDAAWRRISASGVAGLTARELATDTGCAVGSIYTAFDDLEDIVMHVNLRSLELLGERLRAARTGLRGAEALKALALAYARFAIEHRSLWDALFDGRLGRETAVPDWIFQANAALLSLIADALQEIPVETTRQDLETRSRTYFAAVHGIVAISLQGRFVGHAEEQVEDELSGFVDLLACGLRVEAIGR